MSPTSVWIGKRRLPISVIGTEGGGTVRHLRPFSQTYRQGAPGGQDGASAVGPTPEALDALERVTAGAKLVRRTGPASYVVVG